MKKIVRTVWISLLSGLAFVSAGCSRQTLPSHESQKVNDEMKDMNTRLDTIEMRIKDRNDPEKQQRRIKLIQRLESLKKTIKGRENACIYGSPEVMQKYRDETNRLKGELDAVNEELDKLSGKQ